MELAWDARHQGVQRNGKIEDCVLNGSSLDGTKTFKYGLTSLIAVAYIFND